MDRQEQQKCLASLRFDNKCNQFIVQAATCLALTYLCLFIVETGKGVNTSFSLLNRTNWLLCS